MFCQTAVALRQLNTETHKVHLYSLGIHMHMVEIDDIMSSTPHTWFCFCHRTLNNSNLWRLTFLCSTDEGFSWIRVVVAAVFCAIVSNKLLKLQVNFTGNLDCNFQFQFKWLAYNSVPNFDKHKQKFLQYVYTPCVITAFLPLSYTLLLITYTSSSDYQITNSHPKIYIIPVNSFSQWMAYRSLQVAQQKSSMIIVKWALY